MEPRTYYLILEISFDVIYYQVLIKTNLFEIKYDRKLLCKLTVRTLNCENDGPFSPDCGAAVCLIARC